MPRSRVLRFVATLAAALFLAGVTGASGLDAVVFHSGSGVAGAVAPFPHVESGSAGQHHHADHCLLAYRLANGQLTPSLAVALRLAGTSLRPAAAPPPPVARGFLPGLHQQSRAPPTPLA